MNGSTKDERAEPESAEAVNGLDLASLHRTAGFMIRIVQLQIFQAFYESFSARGVSTGAYTALVAIHDNPGIQQGVLADCMLIKRSNMTKLVNGLEAQGFVERRGSAVDKRAIDLHLTQKGEALLASVVDEAVAHDLDTMRALSSAEREKLLDYLGRISADLRSRRKFES